MTTESQDRDLVSPLPKLVRFFRSSRDNWKAKCQAAKAQNKLLRNQTRAVERSRDLWRTRAEELARRLALVEQPPPKNVPR